MRKECQICNCRRTDRLPGGYCPQCKIVIARIAEVKDGNQKWPKRNAEERLARSERLSRYAADVDAGRAIVYDAAPVP